jgi:spermidine/putrescine-binding protein
MLKAAFGIIAAGALSLLAASSAQAQSAEQELARLGLLGTFAPDCSQPISRSNGYIVYRALPTGQVQRDTMVSPTERMFVSVIEAVVQVSGNDVTAAAPPKANGCHTRCASRVSGTG